MLVYRICKKKFATNLDGQGAKQFGARWNSPGNAAIYTSTHLSLAALELLVHTELDLIPSDLVWVQIEIPDSLDQEKYSGSEAPDERSGRAYGDNWLQTKHSLSLMVPSAVIAIEQNVILNPNHKDFTSVKLLKQLPFSFDSRLFKS